LAQDVPYVITALMEDQPRYVGRAAVAFQVLRHYLDLGRPRGRLPELLKLLDQAPPAGMASLPFVAHHAGRILVSGHEEQATVLRHLPHVKTAIAPFGSTVMEADVGPEPFIEAYGVRDFVLCVGRLEARKNQLMLLAALEDDDIPLVFAAGDFSFQPEYVAYCRRFGRRAPTLFLGRLAPEMLVSAYRAARVHCLPSWYELPGLVTLEAARYGAAVVSSRWGTIEDYLGDAGRYCEPDDPAGIRDAILEALAAGPLPGAAERAAQWTWQRHARAVLAEYDAVLAGEDPVEVAPAALAGPPGSKAR
jgi:glycosyltransferase involved in cell wall biosynthesis